MAYDLEEQEQIAQFKAFWQRWGTLISGVVVVAILAYVAYAGYAWYQKRQVAHAEAVFATFDAQLRKKEDTSASLTQLQKEYSKTHYASLASLAQAAFFVSTQKYTEAQAPLQWAIEHGTVENQGMARVRMADVLMQLGKKDEALKALDTPVAHFDAVFANKKADIYLMGQEPAKAREVLTAALESAKKSSDSVAVEVLQEKLKFIP